MITFKEFLEEGDTTSSVVTRLEKIMGAKIKKGYNTIDGIQVYIEGQEPDEESLELHEIEPSELKPLIAFLKSKKFGVKKLAQKGSIVIS